MSATTIHLGDGWVLAWELVLTVYMLTWLTEQVINARKRYWQKQLSKTIAQRAEKGLPIKVFVEENPSPPAETEQPGRVVEESQS